MLQSWLFFRSSYLNISPINLADIMLFWYSQDLIEVNRVEIMLVTMYSLTLQSLSSQRRKAQLQLPMKLYSKILSTKLRLKLYKYKLPLDNSFLILFNVSSSYPVTSTPNVYSTSLSSSLSYFTGLCQVSLTGFIIIITLINREVVSIGNDFCFTTFYNLFNRNVNLISLINRILIGSFM